MLQFILGFIFGGITAKIADDRGRNPVIWFFIGFFSGIIGIFILLLLSKKEKVIDIGKTREMTLRKCSNCGEIIKISDAKCKYCGSEQL